MQLFRKTISLWVWIGRIVPLSTLFILSLIVVFTPESFIQWFMIVMATSFATIAFIFWWWVIWSIKTIYNCLSQITDSLRTITSGIAQTKDILHDDKNIK